MERLNRILRHPLWKGALQQIEELESERIFCRHDLDHFLHVARIAYIENLEQSLDLSKEIIYAAALLHDIGRGLQYEKGIPHEEASAALAEGILTDCGFVRMKRKSLLRQSLPIEMLTRQRDMTLQAFCTGRTKIRETVLPAKRSMSVTGAEKRKILG